MQPALISLVGGLRSASESDGSIPHYVKHVKMLKSSHSYEGVYKHFTALHEIAIYDFVLIPSYA